MSAGSAVLRLPHVYYGWVLVAALGVTTVISYGTTEYLFGVLIVPVGRDLGGSRADLSGAFALSVIVAGLLGVPIGHAVDRHGARLLMAVGSALAGLSLLGLSAVQTLWQFEVLWSGGIGLAMALTWYPVTFTVIATWFHHRRGTALAVLTLLGGLASPIFIPLTGVLIVHLGWRAPLVALALVQLGVALPLHGLAVRRRPEDLGLLPDGALNASLAISPPLSGLTLRAALRQSAFVLLTVSYALVTLATTVILVHGIPYLIGRGYDPILAASLMGLVGLASLPGRLILNLLSDHVGPRKLLGLCLVLQAIGVVLLMHGSSLGWIIAYVVVYGGAYGAISPLRAAVMADHFGRRAYGAITAVQGVPVALCAGLGPLAAGWLYDRLGTYDWPLGLSVGAFLLASMGIFLTPMRRSETGAD